GIKRRGARHDQNATIVYIESDDRSLFAFKRFESGVLKLSVQGQMHGVTWHVADLVEHSHATAQGIDFNLLAATLAAQHFLPVPFQPVLTDLVADHVTLLSQDSQLFLIDLAQIAQHVSRHDTVGIAAPWPYSQRHSRQVELMA